MKESTIERAVVKYAKEQGCLVYKLYGKHDPDRLFVAPDGHAFFIEFKAPNCVPRPGQLHTHQKIREAGHMVYVIDDRTRGEQVIDEELWG